MVIVLLAWAAVFAAAACGGSTNATRLAIALYPGGRGSLPVHPYALRCDPARGTVPQPLVACRRLARLGHPFASVAPGTICSQVALGPQEALVTGTVRGQRVTARLSLRDSCEIARWRRLRSVVPGFPT